MLNARAASKHRSLQGLAAVAAVLLGSTSAPAFADGLKVQSDTASWPKWQARIGIVAPKSEQGSTGLLGQPTTDASGSFTTPRAAALLGDYYLTGPGFDPSRVSGGLRATTGWLYGGSSALGASSVSPGSTSLSASLVRSPWADNSRLGHATYIGIGYTGLSLKQGFSVLADFGLVGTPGVAGAPRLDTEFSIRDYRLSPTVRLGMSYAF